MVKAFQARFNRGDSLEVEISAGSQLDILVSKPLYAKIISSWKGIIEIQFDVLFFLIEKQSNLWWSRRGDCCEPILKQYSHTGWARIRVVIQSCIPRPLTLRKYFNELNYWDFTVTPDVRRSPRRKRTTIVDIYPSYQLCWPNWMIAYNVILYLLKTEDRGKIEATSCILPPFIFVGWESRQS